MLNNAMHMMLVPPTCSQLRFLAPALVLYLAPSLVSAQALGPCTIETVAGGASTPVGYGGPAVDAELYGPSDVRVGPDGSLYIADTRHGVVRRVTTEGVIETFAGGGERTLDREPMPAKEASRLGAFSMAVVPDGTLYGGFTLAGSRCPGRIPWGPARSHPRNAGPLAETRVEGTSYRLPICTHGQDAPSPGVRCVGTDRGSKPIPSHGARIAAGR